MGRRLVTCALGALAAVVGSGGAAAEVPVTGLTVVAEEGSQAAGQTAGVNYAAFFPPVMTETGDVLFVADLVGGGIAPFTTGIFRGLPSSLSMLVRDGTQAPETSNEDWKELASTHLVGRAGGTFAFPGQIDLAAGTNDGGVWAGTTGSLTLVGREGQAAPAVEGTVYQDLSFFGTVRSFPALNASGSAAIRAFLVGPFINAQTDEAIVVATPGTFTKVYQEGDLAPGLDLVTFVDEGGGFDGQLCFSPPSVNTAGKIAFAATVTGVGVTPLNAHGIWFGPRDSVGVAQRAGDTVPTLAGRFFHSFPGAPVINDADQIAVWAHTVDDQGLNPGDGVFLGASGGLSPVVLQGFAAPGEVTAVNFGSSFSPLRMNGAGQLAFVASLSSGQTGLYGYDAVQGVRRLARSQTDAAGIPGETYGPVFDGVCLNGAGKVVFRNMTTSGAVTGIWIADVATGQVDLLARTGAATTVDGVQRTFTDLQLYDSQNLGDPQSGRACTIDASGNVVFLAAFTGGTNAIIRTGNGVGCGDLAACRAALQASLPNPATITNSKKKAVAKQLKATFALLGKALDRAARLAGSKRAAKIKEAKAHLKTLVNQAKTASARNRLSVALTTITTPANALKSYVK